VPLGKTELDSILGLTTNRNETSGINSPQWSSMSAWAVENASSGATPPNTMQDCANIYISRNKQAQARTAFEEVWDFTSTYGSDSTFTTTGLYSIPNSTEDSLIFGWINSTTANIANFTDSSHVDMTSTVYITGGTQGNTFTSGNSNLLCDFSWDTNASNPFPIKSFNLARYVTSYSNIYIFSSNGVFRTTTQYIQNPPDSNGNYNYFKRVILPVVRSLSGSINGSPTAANKWFKSGYQVDIIIVVTDQLSATQVYQGKPSRILTVTNPSTLSSILLTFSVDNTNLFLLSAGIAVFRTVSYLPKTTPPVTYYKCYEAALSSGTTTGTSTTTTFTNVELILNDTSITGFEQLYTQLTVESSASQSAESAAPPTARDVITYNNFTIYGNVMCPPFAPLTMTALPNIDNGDHLKVGSAAIALTYTPNSIITPADTGVIDSVTGTFSGVANNPNNATPTGGTGYHIVLRPQDPNAAASVTGTYSVPYYAIASKLTPVTGLAGSQTFNIDVTPGTSGAIFDITRFPTTGIVAIVKNVNCGWVCAIFSYQSYTQTPASGFYTFSNCIAYGSAFSSVTWGSGGTAATGFNSATPGAYVLYPLNATNITGLGVYAIGSNATGYTDSGATAAQVGFSLAPTFEELQAFNPTIVGNLTALFPITAGAAFDPILATINFNGVFSLDAGALLDSCVRTTCDTYNLARAAEDPYAVYESSSTALVGVIRFESLYSGYNRNSAYANNVAYTNGFGYYDAIKAQVYRSDSTAPTVKFAEPIAIFTTGPGTPTNIMQQSVQTIAGITASKFNKPEEIPVTQNLTPTIVGDPLKQIIKMVNQLDSFLIFKENEGCYRAYIQGTGGEGVLASFTGLHLIDNTAWLLLPESVQVFEGTVVYFSNKAFVTISPMGQVAEISPTIATELLNNYSTIFNNGATDKVRSWVITQQRLYCCYFPNINDDNTSEIFVFSFNTGQWTKWSGEINDAVVSATGLLSLVENIYKFTGAVNTYADIQNDSLSLSNKYWSVLRQADFQNPSQTQIEDIIPFTGLTVSQATGGSAIDIKISNFNTTNVYGNLYYLLSLYKNRTIWYLSATKGFFSATLVAPTSSTSITLQLVNNVYDQSPIVPDGFTATTNDSIVTTVNSALYFNKFFIATPRGSTLSHYNEVQLYTQEGEDYSNLAIGFNSTEVQSQYIYTSNNPDPSSIPANAAIVTTNGSYVILGTTIYESYAPYFVFSLSQYIFRALVPLNAARGRFIQVAILHDTPDEVFILNSITYIYRDLQTTKIKSHS